MIIVYSLMILAFGIILIKATDLTLTAMRRLITVWGIDPYGAASFILALSTSLPELVVALSASVKGEGDLVLGNILGSNIANLSLILGGAAMISGVLRATDTFLKREVMYVFLAGSFPLLLLMDHELNRIDGVVLLLVYGLYNLTVLERKRKQDLAQTLNKESWWQRMLIKMREPRAERGFLHFWIGVGLMIGAAEVVVRSSVGLAELMGLPTLVIGLFVIAVGTSLPELVFEIEAIRKREIGMAFGNILGSVVANSTGILGLTVLIAPVTLTNGFMPYLVATMAYVFIFLAFWGLVRTKHRLDRWEGGVLVGLYLIFVIIELVKLPMN